MYIVASEIITAAGFGKDQLWSSLHRRQDSSVQSEKISWAQALSGTSRLCLIEDKAGFEKRFHDYFDWIWKKIAQDVRAETLQLMRKSKVGLIFSSTKGFHQDYIFNESVNYNQDAFYSVPKAFARDQMRFQPERILCISHACASTHVSLEKAQFWLDNKICEFVILLSGDLVGSFVYQGFQSLKIVSGKRCQPFSEARDGLQLGEACGILILSNQNCDSEIKIKSVKSDNEGSSVTRPSKDGQGLSMAINKAVDKNSVDFDLIVAHGTGTVFNDLSEENAFVKLSGKSFVTGCKGAVGHTLGASGAVDVIAASMVLEKNTVFPITNTIVKNPGFKMNYLTSDYFENFQNEISARTFSNILISSLGFGGAHAALVLQKECVFQ